jgi:hypothetical protein
MQLSGDGNHVIMSGKRARKDRSTDTPAQVKVFQWKSGAWTLKGTPIPLPDFTEASQSILDVMTSAVSISKDGSVIAFQLGGVNCSTIAKWNAVEQRWREKMLEPVCMPTSIASIQLSADAGCVSLQGILSASVFITTNPANATFNFLRVVEGITINEFTTQEQLQFVIDMAKEYQVDISQITVNSAGALTSARRLLADPGVAVNFTVRANSADMPPNLQEAVAALSAGPKPTSSGSSLGASVVTVLGSLLLLGALLQ